MTMGRGARCWWWSLAAAIFVLAAAWRIETLDRRPLWFDERFTQKIVGDAPDAAAIWSVATQDSYQHPPLGYFVAWAAAAGQPTPARLRAPSVVAGLLSIALIAALGSFLFHDRAGLFAAFLAAISLYHLDFSQDARPYMLGLAFTVGLYGALLAYFADGRRRWLVAFAACALGALYTYHLAILHVAVALGASALHLVAARKRSHLRERAVELGLAFTAIALLYLPQLPNLRGFLSAPGLQPDHRLDASPAFLHALVQRWGSGSGSTTWFYEVMFLAGALRLLWRRDLPALVLTGWVLAPLAVFAALPFSKYFDIRFLISSLPVFFLLAGAGMATAAEAAARLLPRRAAAAEALASAALALAFLLPAIALYGRFRESEQRCGDVVHHPEILEANDRLCADHLLLTSIVAEQQWILRSLHATISLDPATLDAYVGRYVFENGPPIEIRRLGERLVVQVPDQLAFEIVPESETRFWYRVLPGRLLTFERGGDGRFDALVLEKRGIAARARREP